MYNPCVIANVESLKTVWDKYRIIYYSREHGTLLKVHTKQAAV